MQRASDSARPASSLEATPGVPAERHEPRNLAMLALHQIVVRIGWIFKTESIIIPAFLDMIVGTAWLRDVMRGCLPLLNRFGHSVPPLLFSRRLKVMPRKRWMLTASSVGMALVFLFLAGLWFAIEGQGGAWLPWVFMGLYGLFFMFTGLNQLALQTLQGKLIRANLRGRLMTLSTVIGAPAAIVAAWIWLGPWLALPDKGFGLIFAFTGGSFLLAALCSMGLREAPDAYEEKSSGAWHHFQAAWQIIRSDPNFRLLALVAGCFSVVLMLFPHYQALGRERLGLMHENLLLWVIVQNAGTGMFSLLAGPVADWRGNRLVLCVSLLCCASTPLLATGLAQAPPQLGEQLYWLVFAPIGLTPVVLRTLMNYTLEICEPSEHPRYVSTMSLCVAAPIMLFSPLLGLVVTLTSFEFVFLFGAAVILLAAFLSLRLKEPRHETPD